MVKTQFMVNNRGIIIHKTNQKRGYRHDYDIYKNHHLVIPKQVVNVFDLGYFGIEKDFLEQLLSALPYKKQSNLDLSTEEKEYNKIHSKKRIIMEHTICYRLKKYRDNERYFQKQIEKI